MTKLDLSLAKREDQALKVNCSFLFQENKYELSEVNTLKHIFYITDLINVLMVSLLIGQCNLCIEGQFKITLAFSSTKTMVIILILEKAEFSCDICCKVSKTARNLKNHKKKAHSMQMLTCTFCTKLFSR